MEALRRQNYYLSRLISEVDRGGLEGSVSFPPKRVEYHFAALRKLVDPAAGGHAAIDAIQRLLSELYSQLSAIEPASGLSENPFSSAATVRQDIFHRLRTEAASAPDPVRRWLRQIAANAQAVALGDAGERLNEIYQSSVFPLCERLLRGRYPFTPGSRQEINVYDFGRLFGEGGVLDGFFSEYLAPYVDTATTPWQWRKTAQKSLAVSEAALEPFQRAQVIRQAFFPEGGKLPSVRFSLIPRRIDPLAEEFSLHFGGQSLAFEGLRPSPVDGTWPGPNLSSHLLLKVRDLDGEEHQQRREGQWAFYRLVNPSRLRPGADRFPAAFSVQGFRHTFEVRAFSVINPFGLNDLQAFRCPKTL